MQYIKINAINKSIDFELAPTCSKQTKHNLILNKQALCPSCQIEKKKRNPYTLYH